MFEFRDYQKSIIADAIKKIFKQRLILLCMEVRTGKTLTALGVADGVKANKVLFITTAKVIKDGTVKRDYDLFGPSFELELINYESLHKITDKDHDFIIVDESHKIGAFPKPSSRAKKVKAIVGNKKVLLLSGTPTPESFSQIFHQFYISDYSPFHEANFYQWAKGYVSVRQKKVAHGRIVNDYSNANENLIRQMISSYMISYTQAEAGFKSKVIEKVINVKMKPVTYNLVSKLEKDKVYEGKKGGVILGDTPVKLMSKVHQIYSGTVKLEDGQSIIIDNTKAECIKHHFQGKKIAIFYKFNEELNLIKQALGGSVTTDLHEFNGSRKSIALQIVAGREGISLAKAEALVFFNIDFSATSYWQSRDRLTTKEREKNEVFYLFAEGGLEHKIYEAVLNKKSFTTKHYERSRLSA